MCALSILLCFRMCTTWEKIGNLDCLYFKQYLSDIFGGSFAQDAARVSAKLVVSTSHCCTVLLETTISHAHKLCKALFQMGYIVSLVICQVMLIVVGCWYNAVYAARHTIFLPPNIVPRHTQFKKRTRSQTRSTCQMKSSLPCRCNACIKVVSSGDCTSLCLRQTDSSLFSWSVARRGGFVATYHVTQSRGCKSYLPILHAL